MARVNGIRKRTRFEPDGHYSHLARIIVGERRTIRSGKPKLVLQEAGPAIDTTGWLIDRKSLETNTSDQIRWKFLRHNKEYIRDFEDLLYEIENDPDNDEVEIYLELFLQKWCISDAVTPNMKDLPKGVFFTVSSIISSVTFDGRKAPKLDPGVLSAVKRRSRASAEGNDDIEPVFLNITLDLNTLTTSKVNLGSIVNRIKEQNGMTKKQGLKRIKESDLYRCLEIYELIVIEKLPKNIVARRVYQEEPKPNTVGKFSDEYGLYKEIANKLNRAKLLIKTAPFLPL